MIDRTKIIPYELQIVDDYISSGQYLDDYRDDIHTEDDMMNFIERCTLDDIPDEYIEARMTYYFMQEDEYLHEGYDRLQDDDGTKDL